MNKKLYNYILLVISLLAMALGITLLLKSGLGVDPYSVFLDGMSKQLNITFGQVSMILSIAVTGIAFLYSGWSKKDVKVGVGTLIYLITFGFLLDSFMMIIPAYTQAWIQVLYLLCGIIILGVGTGLFINVNMGVGTLEIILFLISNTFNLSIRTSKMIFDALACMVGFLLGGIAGMGTILCIVLMGSIIDKVVELKKASES